MFKITLSPCASETFMIPDITVSGDVLTFNGEEFDFSQLTEGDSIRANAVDHPQIEGVDLPNAATNAIYRKDGDIYLKVLFPVYWNSPQTARFPDPDVVSVSEGAVPFPDITPDPSVQMDTSQNMLNQIVSTMQPKEQANG